MAQPIIIKGHSYDPMAGISAEDYFWVVDSTTATLQQHLLNTGQPFVGSTGSPGGPQNTGQAGETFFSSGGYICNKATFLGGNLYVIGSWSRVMGQAYVVPSFAVLEVYVDGSSGSSGGSGTSGSSGSSGTSGVGSSGSSGTSGTSGSSGSSGTSGINGTSGSSGTAGSSGSSGTSGEAVLTVKVAMGAVDAVTPNFVYPGLENYQGGIMTVNFPPGASILIPLANLNLLYYFTPIPDLTGTKTLEIDFAGYSSTGSTSDSVYASAYYIRDSDILATTAITPLTAVRLMNTGVFLNSNNSFFGTATASISLPSGIADRYYIMVGFEFAPDVIIGTPDIYYTYRITIR